MDMQDSILIQKAQVDWYEQGDSNSKYFHSMIRDKRNKLKLHRIKNNRGNWVQGDEKISKAAVKHFENLFTHQHNNVDMTLLNCIPSNVTEDENRILNDIPSENEVKQAVFDMSPSSTAGPEGFNGTFYQTCWDIIKYDVTDMVQDFFNGKNLTKFYSHTCLVLIPKVTSPNTFSDLRPQTSDPLASIISLVKSFPKSFPRG